MEIGWCAVKKRVLSFLAGIGLLLAAAGCTGQGTAYGVVENPAATVLPTQPTETLTDVPPTTAASLAASTPTQAETSTVTPLPLSSGLAPEDWMDWPVMPVVTQHVQEIYALGQSLGRDPRAFSIFGDCQSVPEEFLGLYVKNSAAYHQLPEELQATVDYFYGSMNRESPTVKPGTTTGALLWEDWHEQEYGCVLGETPVACEIRLHNPAFVIITVGTHYEDRNYRYLQIIVEDLMAQGIVPVLATKADNREGDHRINADIAQLAVDYDLPLWNWWAATADLPDHGLETHKGEEYLGKIYFNEEVKDRHRLNALQVIYTLWQAVRE